MFKMFSSYPAIDFILVRDFNARCGELQDIIIDDFVDFIFEEISNVANDDSSVVDFYFISK